MFYSVPPPLSSKSFLQSLRPVQTFSSYKGAMSMTRRGTGIQALLGVLLLAVATAAEAQTLPEVSIAGPAGNITEGSPAVFTITSNTAAGASGLVVNLTVTDASDGQDFTSSDGSHSVTIASGETSTTISVATVDDSLHEFDGVITVAIEAAAAYTISTSGGSATASIVSNDPTVVSLSAPTSVNEGAEAMPAVVLSRASAHTLTVRVSLAADGSAQSADLDRSLGTIVVNVPPGDLTKTLSVPTAEDTTDESDETFTLMLPPASLRNQQRVSLTTTQADLQAIVTIIDDDPTEVELARVGAGAVAESGIIEFTVSLSRALVTGERVDVPLSVTGHVDLGDLRMKTGTTTVGLENASGATPTVVFEVGDQTATLELPVTDDSDDETDETATVALGAVATTRSDSDLSLEGTGTLVSHSSSANSFDVTLEDNDPTTVTLSLPTSRSVAEEGPASIGFTLSLSRQLAAGESIAVPLVLSGSNITVDDLENLTGSGTGITLAAVGTLGPVVTFAGAGAQSAALSLDPSEDGTDEPDETLNVAIGSETALDGETHVINQGTPNSGNGRVNRGPRTDFDVTLVDSDIPAVTITVAAQTRTEGEGAVFMLSASPTPHAALPVMVSVSENGSFVASTNEGAKSVVIGTSGTGSHTVPTVNDSTDEVDGQVTLTLVADTRTPPRWTGGGSESINLHDNDPTTVTLQVVDNSATEEASSETASMTLSLNRSLVAGETLEVPLGFAGGTEGGGNPAYSLTLTGSLVGVSLATSTVTFTGRSGASQSATISVAANADTDVYDETLTVSIPSGTSGSPSLTATGLSGGASGSRTGPGTITLIDNDVPEIEISGGGGEVTEGEKVELTVTATPQTDTLLTVNYSVAQFGDFLDGGVKTLTAQTVKILAGGTSATISVPTVDDSTDEATGTVTVTIAEDTGGGYVLGSASSSTTVKVVDDDVTRVAIKMRPGGRRVQEGSVRTLTFDIGRGLVFGEVLPIILSTPNLGTRADGGDYVLKGSAATGVSYNNLDNTGTGNTRVTFTGPSSGSSASQAVLTMTVHSDNLTEGIEVISGGASVDNGARPGGFEGTVVAEEVYKIDGGAELSADSFSILQFQILDPPVKSVDLSSSGAATEGGTAVEITATLGSTHVGAALKIPLRVESTSTAKALDYTLSSTTITIATGQRTGTVSLTALTDSVDESDETVVIALGNNLPAGYSKGANTVTTVSIVDANRTLVTIRKRSAAVTSVDEGKDVAAIVRLARALKAGERIDVPLSLSGTGISAEDFDSVELNDKNSDSDVILNKISVLEPIVIFDGAGQQSVELNWMVSADGVNEVTETLTVALGSSSDFDAATLETNVSGGAGPDARNSFVILLQDTDLPQVSVENATAVNEGESLEFTLRANPAPAAALTVSVTVSEATADNRDYLDTGTEGSSSATIGTDGTGTLTVATQDDGTDEPSGAVTVTIGANAAVYGIATGTATAEVRDNDATSVTLAGPSGDVAEGGDKAITLELGRALVFGEVLDVGLDFSGTAEVGTDYTVALSGTPLNVTYNSVAARVSFVGPSAASATLTLSVAADGQDDDAETVGIGLSILSDSTLHGGASRIDNLDDFALTDPTEPVVTIAAGGGVTEGDTAVFTLSASPAPESTLTVTVTVVEDTSGGQGYLAQGETAPREVELPPAGTATFSVRTVNDSADEPAGAVTATVGPGSGYTVGTPASASAAVADDDATPGLSAVSFASGASQAREGDAAQELQITLTPAPSTAVTLSYTVGGTATTADYTVAPPSPLTVSAGTQAVTLTVTIIDDTVAEDKETVELTLGDGTNYDIGRGTHVLSLAGSDRPSMAIDGTVKARPGRAYTFRASDFSFSDDDGDPLERITIVGLPQQGELALSGVAVAVNAVVTRAQLDAGVLVFTPAEGGIGVGYASFRFRVNDGGAGQEADLTIDVSNALPTATPDPIRLRPGEVHEFSVADFGYADSDGDPLAQVKIETLPQRGELRLAGAALTEGNLPAEVSRTQLDAGSLGFVQTDDEMIANPYASFRFRVNDGFADSAVTSTLTIEVVSVSAERMLEGWLARFGRTVAEQVVEAVESRFEASPGGEAAAWRLQLGGRELKSLLPADEAGTHSAGTGQHSDSAESPLAARKPPQARASGTESFYSRREAASKGFGTGDWLGGSAFRYAAGDTQSGLRTLWGRGAVAQFDGRDDTARLDGRVESAMLGADFVHDGRSLGLLLAHSRGRGDYRDDAAEGRLRSELTGVYPYAKHEWRALALWGVAGFANGRVRLIQATEMLRTDLRMWMLAGGVKGQLWAGRGHAPELSAVADLLWVDTHADGAAERLSPVDAETSRVRLGLEGTWKGTTLGGGWLRPRARLSLRHDGGDAEHGFGTELRAGADWKDALRGLVVQLHGHLLLTHEASGAQAKGVSGSLAWDPRPDSLHGAALALKIGAGEAEQVDDALLAGSAVGEGSENKAQGLYWRATLDWGLGAFDDRFTAIPQASFGTGDDGREFGLGWRLVADDFDLQLQARRHVGEDTEDQVELSLEGRW